MGEFATAQECASTICSPILYLRGCLDRLIGWYVGYLSHYINLPILVNITTNCWLILSRYSVNRWQICQSAIYWESTVILLVAYWSTISRMLIDYWLFIGHISIIGRLTNMLAHSWLINSFDRFIEKKPICCSPFSSSMLLWKWFLICNGRSILSKISTMYWWSAHWWSIGLVPGKYQLSISDVLMKCDQFSTREVLVKYQWCVDEVLVYC